MPRTSPLTAAEVAFVLREPLKAIKKALDEGPVRSRLSRKAHGGGSVRTVDWRDVFYLFAVRALRDELTVKARRDFHAALKRTPLGKARVVKFGRLSVAIADLRADLESRTSDLDRLAGKVVFRADGEPVLKRSKIEVYRLSALLAGGMTPAEICEDFPPLTPADVATAKAYAEVYPKAGRPYPPNTVKRAIRGAGLEALDEVMGKG